MHRFASLRNGSIVTLCSLSTIPNSNCENAVKRRPLYCTSDDIPLNNSDISTSSGFYIQFDSRTRNPKYVVQRSIHTSNVRNFCLYAYFSLSFSINLSISTSLSLSMSLRYVCTYSYLLYQ